MEWLVGGGVVVFVLLWAWSKVTGWQRAHDEVAALRQLNERQAEALEAERAARVEANRRGHSEDTEAITRIRTAAAAARLLREATGSGTSRGDEADLPGNGTAAPTKNEPD